MDNYPGCHSGGIDECPGIQINMEKVIEIEHLKKSFADNTVIKDLSLHLLKGENLVILGKSGQGKSVTIKCIVGMITPDEGSIKVFGEEVTNLDETQLLEFRVKMGFLFQGGALYDSMSVRDNLEFPLRKVLRMKDEHEITDRCIEILDAVGLSDSIDLMPSSLSGGMRKRMALARTLIVRPQILFYDEPTTGLDPVTSSEISELILHVQEKYKTSSIIVTHDISCTKITGDRIIILDDGKCRTEGTFEELKNSKDKLTQAFFKSI